MTQQPGPVGPNQDDEIQPAGDVHIVPEERRGTPPGMTEADVELRSEIAQRLGRSAFPGETATLVDTAAENGAPDFVLSRLGSLPKGRQYENMQDVARALGLGTETRRT